MSDIRAELQRKTQWAIIQHAFLRWESAVVLAGTILLIAFLPHPFPWWPVWGWPVLGVLALSAVVYSSMTDANTSARVVQGLLRTRFNVDRLRDRALRADLESALDYHRHIEAYVRGQRDAALRARLEEVANQLVDWLANMYRLALRLDVYRFDALLAKARAVVPDEIKSLTERRQKETNPVVQHDLDRVLASKQKQLQMLETLDTRMKQAELQLEQSLTALATVYSQVQLVDARDVDSSRADRLRADIQEQIEQLNNLVSGINAVYDYHSAGTP
jgi:hypothetical protein